MASYWDNDYNHNYYSNEHTQLDSSCSSSSPLSLLTADAPSLSADYDWFPMTTSSINSSAVWPEYPYPIELRRSSDSSSSSKYFKWVRPIARPGRHSSPDDESDIDEDGTDDSFLEVEYPVTTTMTYGTTDYDSLFVGSGSFVPEQQQQQQQQQQGLHSPKTKYFKWARPGRRCGDDSDGDNEEEDTDMDCADEDETVMFSGEDEYFSDASSYTSVYQRGTRTKADSYDGNSDDQSMSMKDPIRL